MRRHGELQQHEGQKEGDKQWQILLHHGQTPRCLDPGQQPEAEHEFTYSTTDRQCPAGDIQRPPAMHDKGQHRQGKQGGEVTPAAAGDRERNEQREQQIAYPLHAQGPGGEVPGQPLIRHYLQQQEGAWQRLGRGEGGTKRRHSFPLPHLEQGAAVEAHSVPRLVKLPAYQQHQGHNIEGVDPGQSQPEKAAIADGAAGGGEGLTVDMGQHQPAQDKEEIDPEIAILDELGDPSYRLHPLGKEQQTGVEQHHHQGSDAPQRR